MKSWDEYFLEECVSVASRSKDPSTKCGVVIVRPDNTIASTGYNGFPRKMADNPEWLNNREEKYSRVIHSELNAILSLRERAEGYTMYLTGPPCDRCCVHSIQAGITRFVWRTPSEDYLSRWGAVCEKSKRYIQDCGCTYTELKGE